jgi:hypothetical protein
MFSVSTNESYYSKDARLCQGISEILTEFTELSAAVHDWWRELPAQPSLRGYE